MAAKKAEKSTTRRKVPIVEEVSIIEEEALPVELPGHGKIMVSLKPKERAAVRKAAGDLPAATYCRLVILSRLRQLDLLPPSGEEADPQ